MAPAGAANLGPERCAGRNHAAPVRGYNAARTPHATERGRAGEEDNAAMNPRPRSTATPLAAAAGSGYAACPAWSMLRRTWALRYPWSSAAVEAPANGSFLVGICRPEHAVGLARTRHTVGEDGGVDAIHGADNQNNGAAGSVDSQRREGSHHSKQRCDYHSLGCSNVRHSRHRFRNDSCPWL